MDLKSKMIIGNPSLEGQVKWDNTEINQILEQKQMMMFK